MTTSTARFQVCLWAALLATVIEIVGVRAAAACPIAQPVAASLSAQAQFVGAGNGAALR
jgi:hypothetical protein